MKNILEIETLYKKTNKELDELDTSHNDLVEENEQLIIGNIIHCDHN